MDQSPKARGTMPSSWSDGPSARTGSRSGAAREVVIISAAATSAVWRWGGGGRGGKFGGPGFSPRRGRGGSKRQLNPGGSRKGKEKRGRPAAVGTRPRGGAA